MSDNNRYAFGFPGIPPGIIEKPKPAADESAQRKGRPMATGCLYYFPDALEEISRLSRLGNDKHNPGQHLHWSRDKSTDHADCVIRHLKDAGPAPHIGVDDTSYPEPVLHAVEAAWRSLALAQLAIEAYRKSKP